MKNSLEARRRNLIQDDLCFFEYVILSFYPSMIVHVTNDRTGWIHSGYANL